MSPGFTYGSALIPDQYDLRTREIAQEYDQHLGPVNTITFVDVSDMPARNTCCLSSSGLNLTTLGVLPLVNAWMH
jgi:hypothetical protein